LVLPFSFSVEARANSVEAIIKMAIERQSPAKGGGTGGGPGNPDQSLQRTSNFLKETITELQKTKWPTTQEAWKLTYVVLTVIFVLGIYMGLLDFAMTTLVAKFSLIK
jgi:preprotein translocase SecE subunit